jgi:predicted cupin superfamily sugar epimerase
MLLSCTVNTMRADEIIRLLGLECLPEEGGFFRETWRSTFACGHRASGTAIYYLITDGPDGFSAFHSLGFDELYHFYAGDPVELHLLEPGRPAALSMLGIDFAAGQRPQVLVPAGSIQGARMAGGGRWALLGTTMAPGYDPSDFRLSRRDELLAAYPESALLIEALTRLGH